MPSCKMLPFYSRRQIHSGLTCGELTLFGDPCINGHIYVVKLLFDYWVAKALFWMVKIQVEGLYHENPQKLGALWFQKLDKILWIRKNWQKNWVDFFLAHKHFSHFKAWIVVLIIQYNNFVWSCCSQMAGCPKWR